MKHENVNCETNPSMNSDLSKLCLISDVGNISQFMTSFEWILQNQTSLYGGISLEMVSVGRFGVFVAFHYVNVFIG